MAGVEIGDFGSPDETRTPDKTTVEIVRIVPRAIARGETRERFASR